MATPMISLTPIGTVRNNVTEKMCHGWGQVESDITLDQAWTDCLDGIEEFSHIIILFWMHRSCGPVPTKVHPQGRADMPLTGVLATRAPHRPNPIGMSTVALLERRQNTIKVKGLDAIDGTPVLDIKPYLPKDCVSGAQHPDWVARLNSS